MRIRFWVLIVIGLVTAFSLPAFADPSGTTVEHVNYEKKTITLLLYRRDQGTRQVTTYKIDMGCTFKLDGDTVPFRKIHRGQHVIGMTMGDTKIIDGLSVQSAD